MLMYVQSNKEKNGNKIFVFAGILKVNDEHRRIRIEDARIRIH
jgi:F0F1-type ATP synthase epsilon subunit